MAKAKSLIQKLVQKCTFNGNLLPAVASKAPTAATVIAATAATTTHRKRKKSQQQQQQQYNKCHKVAVAVE